MAKRVVIIDGRNYDVALDKLRDIRSIVGSMRNSEKRNHTLYILDLVFEQLTGPDELEQRVGYLEHIVATDIKGGY